MTDSIFDNLVVNNNLGIGTTEPAAQLHIAVTEGISSKVFLESINGSLLKVTAEPNSASIGTENAFPLSINTNGLPRLQISSEGNVGIGTDKPTAKLEVAGGIQCSGNLSSQAGKVRRDFITWYTVENSSNPIHIKTNIPKKSNVMYRISVESYNYGIAASINSDVVGYTYKDWETIYSAQTNNYANGVSISQYYSLDGYVVIKLTTSNTYCLGFSASAWFTNPPGNGFNISATVYHQSTDL